MDFMQQYLADRLRLFRGCERPAVALQGCLCAQYEAQCLLSLYSCHASIKVLMPGLFIQPENSMLAVGPPLECILSEAEWPCLHFRGQPRRSVSGCLNISTGPKRGWFSAKIVLHCAAAGPCLKRKAITAGRSELLPHRWRYRSSGFFQGIRWRIDPRL